MPIDYIEVSEAKKRPGLRLVLTTGVPGPWGEAAKGVLGVKNIAYTPVRQTAMTIDVELVEWTGQSSAPVAMYEDERPRAGWADILFLAERLQPEPALIPADPKQRAWMLGLCHEICGEHGLGWSRRLQLLAGAPADEPGTLPWKYGGQDARAMEQAEARVADILKLLDDQFAESRARGGSYLMGDSLRAVDIYWACFSNLIEPLSPERSPMPDYIRSSYGSWAGGCSNELIGLRDRVFEEHLGLPQEY